MQSDDGIVPQRLHLCDDFFGRRLLFLRVVKDRRAVLRTGVGPLAIECRRIVNGEEHLEQLAVRDDVGIELDLHDFGMAAGAGAHQLVGRVGCLSTHISRNHLFDAS